jgi:hypothetical protein
MAPPAVVIATPLVSNATPTMVVTRRVVLLATIVTMVIAGFSIAG